MKTLLLILMIYFVLQMLKKAGQGQVPRRDLPEYRLPPEHDTPLPGPWNRRAEPVEQAPLPGPWGGSTEPSREPDSGTAADTPLPGPWDRGEEREYPVATGGYREPEGPAGEPAGRSGGPVPLPRQRDDTGPVPARRREDGGMSGGESVFNLPAAAGPATCQPPERAKPKRRRANPLAAALRDKESLAGSLIAGEVLGRRGGRMAGRKFRCN